MSTVGGSSRRRRAPSHPSLYDEASVHRSASAMMSFVSHASAGTGALVVDLNEDKPIFTIKAVIAGALAGSICTFLALYYGLKVGITPSLNILGGVLGYAVTKVLMQTGIFGTIFTPQENAVIQTLSVATYSIACPAFGFANGWLAMSKEAYEVANLSSLGDKPTDIIDINFWRSVCWCLSLFSFGFFLAYAVRNYYCITKNLMFPSGTATAYVINALHASKENAAIGLAQLGKMVSLAFSVNMVTWMIDGLANFPILGIAAAEYGWTFDFDLGSFGIGMLLSLQVNASMLLGALIIWGGIKPYVANYHNIQDVGADGWYDSEGPSTYVGLYSYGLFSGLAVMIVQGAWGICEILVTVFMSYYRPEEVEVLDDPIERRKREIFQNSTFPLWGSILGYAVSGGVCILVHYFMLDTTWWQTLTALAIIPFFAMSNIEGMGRTDWDVASSYGKLIMFPIGAINKGKSIIPSLAVCHTTISGCSNAAILMQDFKTGLLLGASPAYMFLAQILGCVTGCVVCPALFTMLRAAWQIPIDMAANPDAFLTGLFGPIFRSLAVVATHNGFDALPTHTLDFCYFFGGLTLLLNFIRVACDRWAPKVSSWIPEPSGLSIGMLVGPSVPMEFLIGGVCSWWWMKHRWVEAERQIGYTASGLVAGSGLAVVLQCIISLGGVKPPMVAGFALSEAATTAGAKEWAIGGVTLAVSFAMVALGAYSWFKVPCVENETPDHSTSKHDRLDDEDVIMRRVESGNSNGFAEDLHIKVQ